MKLVIHASNISGGGASRLVSDLLPEIERNSFFDVHKIVLPEKGDLASYQSHSETIKLYNYKRTLPNAFSRFFEIMFFCPKLSRDESLLVLGDLPFKTKSKQLLYFHNARILADSRSNFGGLIQRVNDSIKLFIARKLFSKNLKYVDYVIVQTDLMRRRFLENNPLFKGKVIVILPAVTHSSATA